MVRTALDSFITTEPDAEPVAAVPKPARSNTAMEALFARTPICLPVAAAPTTADATKAALMTPHTAEQNPIFAAHGEQQLVPVMNLNSQHFGAKAEDGARVQPVARYGRLYKRKAPSARLWKATRANAPPGTRFCRFCDDFIPLDRFYTQVKRYVCRKHHMEQVWAAEDRRVAADPTVGFSNEAWIELTLVRSLFGYDSVNFSCGDMRMLIIHAGVPWGLHPRVLPIDPSLPMRPRNVAVVTQMTFSMLLEVYQHTCSRALYIAHVQRCNLLPPHLDVAWPDNPFQDPAYRRVDIDVGPLLRAEMAGGLGECVDRTAMETLLAAEPPAPWCQGPSQTQPACVAMRVRSYVCMSKLALTAAESAPKPPKQKKAKAGAV